MDNDAPHRLRWPRVFARVAATMLLAVGLYFLSYGPAIYLFMTRSKDIDHRVDSFYWPIHQFAGRLAPGFPLLQYRSWWYSLPGGPNDRLWRRNSTEPPR